MKKLLICLLPVCALSEDIRTSPYLVNYGCFVENGYNDCSNAFISCGTSAVQNALDFGKTVGELCDRYVYMTSLKNTETARADNNYNVGISCSASLSTETARADNNYAAWVEQVALVRKLKKACGTKCKKIR